MDEKTLEDAITAYSAQLQQVEMALSAGLDPSQQSDLLQLKEDLCQLLELTEASLVSVKKSQLLASLEESTNIQEEPPEPAVGTANANGSMENEFASFYLELGENSSSDTKQMGDGGGEEEEEEEEEEDDDDDDDSEDILSGTKVRAPYRTSWGTLEYHNAMVVGTEPADDDEAQVRVLYIYPTQKSMKPCPFFLEDKCRFMDNCRFSHGEVVYVSELRDFLHFDLTKLEEGSSCLVRHEDGIWYPAKITDIDNGFYSVKFDSLLMKDAVVEADGVIPPMREEDPPSSNSDQDDTENGDEAYARVFDSASEESAATISSNFGGWEEHTRGIGSKLMLKMGYEYGKGLGKLQEGRVEPVTAVLLPKGKSLDQCAELTGRRTQSKMAKDGGQVARRKRQRKPRAGATGGRHNVFEFLNSKLGDGQAASGSQAGAAPARGRGVEAYRGEGATRRSLNVKLFQAAERVAHTEREIKTLTESLSRRAGRDAAVVSRLEEKLSAAHRLLAQQKAQETSVQKEHRKADTHKKMTEF